MIHYAKLEKSPRLKRLLAFLQDGLPHSTRDIIYGAEICAVNSAVSELRRNGFEIDTITNGKIFEYRLIGGGKNG